MTQLQRQNIQRLTGRWSILNLTVIRTNGAFATRSSQITLRTCLSESLGYRVLEHGVVFRFGSLKGTVRVPWLSIIKSPPMYALSVAHFTCNLGYYTLLTCLPQYFKHILHFDIKSVSLTVYILVCFLLAICRPSGCIVVSGVVVVGACNRSQMRTSKCTCLNVHV